MSNYISLNRLCSELNRTLGVTSDIERENLIHSNHNKIRTLFLKKVKVINNVIG